MIVFIALIDTDKVDTPVTVVCCEKGHKIVLLRQFFPTHVEMVLDREKWQHLHSIFRTVGDAKAWLYQTGEDEEAGLFDVKNGKVTRIPVKDHGASACE